jgi:hypothetical protein
VAPGRVGIADGGGAPVMLQRAIRAKAHDFPGGRRYNARQPTRSSPGGRP